MLRVSCFAGERNVVFVSSFRDFRQRILFPVIMSLSMKRIALSFSFGIRRDLHAERMRVRWVLFMRWYRKRREHVGSVPKKWRGVVSCLSPWHGSISGFCLLASLVRRGGLGLVGLLERGGAGGDACVSLCKAVLSP
jgi:hypothetical protein